jgi:hypothetical protein
VCTAFLCINIVIATVLVLVKPSVFPLVALALFPNLLAEGASDAAEETLLGGGGATVPACLAEGQSIADAVHRAYLRAEQCIMALYLIFEFLQLQMIYSKVESLLLYFIVGENIKFNYLFVQFFIGIIVEFLLSKNDDISSV